MDRGRSFFGDIPGQTWGNPRIYPDLYTPGTPHVEDRDSLPPAYTPSSLYGENRESQKFSPFDPFSVEKRSCELEVHMPAERKLPHPEDREDVLGQELEAKVRDLQAQLASYEQRQENRAPRREARERVYMAKFDGSSDWDAYLVQFKIVAEANGWSLDEKRVQLISKLEGEAARILARLCPTDQGDLFAITQALSRRFSSTGPDSYFMNLLSQRVQKPGETVQQLADEIESLAIRAFPNADSYTFQSLGMYHFINALESATVRQELRKNRPRTLNAAVGRAIELEAVSKVEEWRCRGLPNSGIPGAEGPTRNEPRERVAPTRAARTDSDDLAGIKEQLSELATLTKLFKEQMDTMRGELDRRTNSDRNRRPYSSQTTPLCWNCGRKGHTSRYCRQPKIGNGYTFKPQYSTPVEAPQDKGEGN